ncbi:MAG: type 1 secretion protein, partial [Comamonadaceae bacterium]
IDTTAPAAAETVAITAITTDTGSSASDFVTSDTSLTVSGTNAALSAGNKIQVSSDGGTTWADATVTGTTWTYADPVNHATSFTYQTRVVDVAGNVGNTASQAVTIDTTAPAAAETVAITAITTDSGSSASDFITNDTSLTVSGTNAALSAGNKIQVSSDGGVTWADATVTGTTWTYTDPANHATSFSYQARVVDVAGNIGQTATQAVTIDTTAPSAAETVTITAITTDTGTSASDFVTSDTSLTVSGTNAALSPGNKIQVSSDGGTTWADAAVAGATWSYVDPANHATSFTYNVRIVDVAGNVGNIANQAVTIDTTAPAAAETVAITAITTDTGTSASDFVTSDTSLTVSGTNAALSAGHKIQVSSDGGVTWADATVTGTTWTYTDPANHATSFSYQARVVDIAGNVGNTATQAVTIDTTAPTAAET